MMKRKQAFSYTVNIPIIEGQATVMIDGVPKVLIAGDSVDVTYKVSFRTRFPFIIKSVRIDGVVS